MPLAVAAAVGAFDLQRRGDAVALAAKGVKLDAEFVARVLGGGAVRRHDAGRAPYPASASGLGAHQLDHVIDRLFRVVVRKAALEGLGHPRSRFRPRRQLALPVSQAFSRAESAPAASLRQAFGSVPAPRRLSPRPSHLRLRQAPMRRSSTPNRSGVTRRIE